MAQGRLLVASDVGGHKELIRHKETGWLFQAGSAHALAAALEEVLANPEECETVRMAARRFVEQERNWRESAARYLPVYQGLVRRPAAVAA
jgi:glycosyltransferase involved in cell wall biosynthesis